MPCIVNTSGDDAWERKLLSITLCGVLSQLETKGELSRYFDNIDWPPREPRQLMSYREFAEKWWEDHKKEDAERRAYELRQLTMQQKKLELAAKLTPEERKLVGL